MIIAGSWLRVHGTMEILTLGVANQRIYGNVELMM